MTLGNSAFGITLARNSVIVAEVVDVNGPSLTREEIDVTHHQSPNRWREIRKGLKDGGEITFTINYVPTAATQNASTGLLSDFGNDTTIDTWTITFPNGTIWTLPGFVTQFEPGAPIDDKLSADITIRVAGQPTLA